MAGTSARVVEILITGNSGQAIAEIEKLTAATEGAAAKSSSAFANFGKIATLGIIGAVSAVAIAGVKLAEDGEVATARLKKAVDNAGISWSSYGGEVDKAKAKSRDLGFSGGMVSESLTKLVNVTKDGTKSISDLTLAEDIARGRKIDLSTATDLLTKVESGHVALLGRLGINTKDATGATISQEEAVKRLTAMYGGQASAYADTFQGKLAVIAAQAKYVAAQIGAFLIPIIEKLGETLIAGVGFLEKHRAAAIALAAVIGTVLVPAMLYWIGTQVVAIATGIASYMETIAIAALYVAEAVGTAATATASFAVAASGPLLIAAAFVALGSVVDHMIGTGGKFQAVTDALAKGEQQGRKYADMWIAIAHTSQTTAGQIDSLKTRLADLKGLLAAQVEAYHDGRMSAEDAARAQGTYTEATSRLRGELDRLKNAQAAAKTAAAEQAWALHDAAQGTVAFRDATEKARKAVYDLQDALFGQTDANFAYQKSLIDVTDKENALAAAIRDHGADSAEAKSAELDLAEAQNHRAESAAALTKASDELYNKIKTGGLPAYDAELTRLQGLQTAYGDSDGAIQAQIDKLNLVWWTIIHMPDYKEVVVKIKTMYEIFGAPGTTPQGGMPYDGYAKGGPVYAAKGFWAPRGTDTVPAMLTPGEFVVPKNGALVKGGSSGPNITINVEGSVVTEGQLVDAIVNGINRKAQSGPVLVSGAVR